MAYPYDLDYEATAKERSHKELKLKTNRSMWKLMVLSLFTLGFYAIAFFVPLSFDLDKVDPKRGRSKTMNFGVAYLLSFFTFSIVITVWHYHIAERVEEALDRRKINYNFGTTDFWTWYFFGTLFLVGPFIYFHKLCKAMNLLCQSYNEKPVLEE